MKKYCFVLIMFFVIGCIGTKTAIKTTPKSDKSISLVKVVVTEALINRGQLLFNRQCASCHGEGGMGDGLGAYLLRPHPRDFSLAKFRLVSTVNHIPSDDDLFKTITNGMPGTAMPPWEHLSKEDRTVLVHYVRHLAKEGKVKRLMAKSKRRTLEKAQAIADRKLTPGEKIKLPDRNPQTMENISEGRRLYVAKCAGCHGPEGTGDGRTDLKDDAGFPIMPRDFTRGVFKGGAQVDDIAYRILAGIPATPMPSFAELTGDELWSLVYYVKSLANPTSQKLVEQKKREVVAKRIDGELNKELNLQVWAQAKPVYLAVLPLWWRKDMVSGVYVQALHNGTQIAVRMVWEDSTMNDHVLGQRTFSDGAAVQFSPSDDPPFFAMGYWQDPVNIWNWKAWREPEASLKYQNVQAIRLNMPDDQYPSAGFLGEKVLYSTASDVGNPVAAKEPASSIEDLNAGGFGTLTSQDPDSQNVTGRGVWKDGFWEVIYIRDMVSGYEGDIKFSAGDDISVAFAIWDGEHKDRNGQKSVTIWHKLIIEEEPLRIKD
ncbi:MAG: c-type cytochrome [Candidatus Anammoxibacter sp.]